MDDVLFSVQMLKTQATQQTRHCHYGADLVADADAKSPISQWQEKMHLATSCTIHPLQVLQREISHDH